MTGDKFKSRLKAGAKAGLKTKLQGLPRCAGVYSFKDAKGKIIYVGKAKSLRSRVLSYFRNSEPVSPRTSELVKKVRDLDFIATRSEMEALILECTLIKQYKPRYNVNLKDDKKYPYIKVTSREPFPAVYATRDLKDERARYFGPYTDAKAMRKTLKMLTEIFPVRTCRRRLPLRQPDRGCLNYHIGRCVGPCRGELTSQSYKKLIQQVCQFLSGKMSHLIRDLNIRMEQEASRLRFEEAARLRDRIQALEKVSQKQVVISPGMKDRDVIAVRSDHHRAVGFVLKIREGKLVGKEAHRLAFEGEVGDQEILRSFLEQYAGMSTLIPEESLIEHRTEGLSLIEGWLRERTGRRVRVQSPKTGKGRELLKMAGDNAVLLLAQLSEAPKPEQLVASSVKDLAESLNLSCLPIKIEAFDISTTQGAQPVASRVCFKNGRPVKRGYRHYSIKTVRGQDDFAMMREVLRRRWTHVVEEEDEPPDLIVVDGGRGQVSSALEGVIDAGGDMDNLPPVVGIAKRLDELFVPDRSEPIQIPHTSPALRLLQRMRDEAHRFAVTYHRKLREQESSGSVLQKVRGIGPTLSRRLLTRFGSVKAISALDIDQLLEVNGISRSKAEAVLRVLHGLSDSTM